MCGVIVDGASVLSFALNHTKTNRHVDSLFGALALTLSLYSQVFLGPFYQLVRLKTSLCHVNASLSGESVG